MANTATPATAQGATQGLSGDMRDRLLKTGLIGAGALTVTWWALIACGLWQAVAWVGA